MKQKANSGFTLVEMMMASAISVILILGTFSSFVNQRKTFEVQTQINEMQQNARVAMDMVSRDARMAGYGLKVSTEKLGDWIDWVPVMTSNPHVIPGSSGDPDRLLIAAAFDEPASTIQVVATNGTTQLTVAPGTGRQFNSTDRKIIFVGKSETFRVVRVAGDVLTISRDPLVDDKGSRYTYQPGTQVEVVQVIDYQHNADTSVYPYQPHLTREVRGATYVANWQKMASGYIDDFQVQLDDASILLDVTALTAKEDEKYTDPNHSDHYRRLTLSQRIFPRNARMTK